MPKEINYQDVKKVADSLRILMSDDEINKAIIMYKDISPDYAEDEPWSLIVEDVIYQIK